MVISRTPQLLAHGGGRYDDWSPPPPPEHHDHGRPDGFAGGVYTVSNGLVRAEGRLAGTGAAIGAGFWGLGTLLKASGAAPMHLTGTLGGVGIVSALAVAGGLGYAGWKGGGMATDALLRGVDNYADTFASKGVAQTLKTAPRAAVAIGVASLASLTLNGMTLNLALPVAGVVAAAGLGGALTSH